MCHGFSRQMTASSLILCFCFPCSICRSVSCRHSLFFFYFGYGAHFPFIYPGSCFLMYSFFPCSIWDNRRYSEPTAFWKNLKIVLPTVFHFSYQALTTYLQDKSVFQMGKFLLITHLNWQDSWFFGNALYRAGWSNKNKYYQQCNKQTKIVQLNTLKS